MPKLKKAPPLVHQFLAEMLGTFMLVLIGDGAIAQYKMLETNSNFVTVALGYGLALTAGIMVSGGVSGGHLNPAVTLAMAVMRKCAWICIPVYMIAQFLGAFTAASVVYGIYYDGIKNITGFNQSAGIFASYPHSE